MIVGTDLENPRRIKISLNENTQTSNDGRLIAQARTSPAAFARLYRRHYDVVFRYCAHRLFERQTAEDITSAVFLKVVENIHRFKGTEPQFRNWLYKIATNAINNHLRKAARRNGLLKVAGERVRSQLADCKDQSDISAKNLARLKRAMFELKPRYQTIITLRFFENL